MSKKENINDDILNDEMIFKMAAEEKNKAVIPETADKKIKETIDKLPKRKNRKYIKYTAIAAAAALLFIISFSAAFPAMAENMPIVGSVIRLFDERKLFGKEYSGYTTKVNISKVSNGTTVTINSVAYDGIALSIGYTVQTKEKMQGEPHILDKTFKINGKVKSFGSGGGGYFIDDKTYEGVDSFISDDYMPEDARANIVGGDVKIPDTFYLDLDIHQFSEQYLKGDWDFKFKVTKQAVDGKVKNIKTSIDLGSLRDKLKVTGLVITPVNTVLRYSYHDIDYRDTDLEFVVLDNKNRVIECRSGDGGSSLSTRMVYAQYIYKNIYPDTTSLTFIPVIMTQRGIDGIEEEVRVPLNKNGVTVLPEGHFGERKITKIEFLPDKTLVYVKNSVTIPFECKEDLSIIDSNGKSYDTCKYVDYDKMNDKENSYVAVLPPLPKDKSYTVESTNTEKYYTLRDDLKFTINIK